MYESYELFEGIHILKPYHDLEFYRNLTLLDLIFRHHHRHRSPLRLSLRPHLGPVHDQFHVVKTQNSYDIKFAFLTSCPWSLLFSSRLIMSSSAAAMLN